MVLSVVPKRHHSMVKNLRLVLSLFLLLFSAFFDFLTESLCPMQLLCLFSASWHLFVAHGYRVVQWNEKSGIHGRPAAALQLSSIRHPRRPALRRPARLPDCLAPSAALQPISLVLAIDARVPVLSLSKRRAGSHCSQPRRCSGWAPRRRRRSTGNSN